MNVKPLNNSSTNGCFFRRPVQLALSSRPLYSIGSVCYLINVVVVVWVLFFFTYIDLALEQNDYVNTRFIRFTSCINYDYNQLSDFVDSRCVHVVVRDRFNSCKVAVE